MEKWAIIGLGFIAPRHVRSIEKLGDTVSVTCDIDPLKKADFLSFEEMIDSPEFGEVDCVSICTPNDCHVPMALECITRGKRVLCEKPLGLSSREISLLPDDGSVFTVLQLRHHPEVIKLKKELNGTHTVKMKIIVPRSDEYWRSWKGDMARSGGVLTNIGVHYFDLLLHLFGQKYSIIYSKNEVTRGWGEVDFNGTHVSYEIGIVPEGDPHDRLLSIDGKEISLSRQDNLSFEDLHGYVFDNFKKGEGFLPREAAKSLELIEKLSA